MLLVPNQHVCRINLGQFPFSSHLYQWMRIQKMSIIQKKPVDSTRICRFLHAIKLIVKLKPHRLFQIMHLSLRFGRR